ncbi:hypothetical protein NDU88_008462 [Pleurodeles waltl]|uniref:Uncharacterized protein n=1 Tax=Pleurodeles waltl TaxID=8319 RepID=A0AAV7N8Z9_PLEWA|nr:hypothetical protein NDU88_008462 [Pleurodeles waltl]
MEHSYNREKTSDKGISNNRGNSNSQSPKKRKTNSVDMKKDGVSEPERFASLSEASQRQRQRKLVLHIDLNNTILVSDAITQEGPSASLNTYLSTVTWGKLNQAGEWEWLSDAPSIQPPHQNAITFHTQFGRDGDFTNTNLGKKFKRIHSDHMHHLEWLDPPDKVLAVTGEDGKAYHSILPSFFHLLETLRKEDRDFSVILRTFGTDLPRVLHAVLYAMEGRHPQFPDFQKVLLHVDQTPGRICCSKKQVVLSRGAEHVSTKLDIKNVYHYFNNLEGIVGFRDNFDWWARNQFRSTGGKPFWIDPQDTCIHHIFIDDNIRLSEDDSIIHTTVFHGKDGGQSRTAPTSELYDICLVQTDLLRAIADKNYFLDCVRTCEERYTAYLAHLSQPGDAS